MEKNKYLLLKLSNVILLILAIIISTIITQKIYFFINPEKMNNVLSKNMLIAIKNYNVSFEDMFKEKTFLRIMEIIILILLFISRFKKKLLYILTILTGLIIGFYVTIFYLEMGYIGIINYILVSFPHQLFYIAAVICLISQIFNKSNTSIISCNNYFDKIAPYLNIILLWFCGILSETVINLFLVQKLFIIK